MLALTEKEYKAASIEPGAFVKDMGARVYFEEGPYVVDDFDKMDVLVKWRNEEKEEGVYSLTGWRWFPEEHALKGFEHPDFGRVEEDETYGPDDPNDAIHSKKIHIFGPSRETTDEKEGFFLTTHADNKHL
jgi:hypothetical protein